MFHRTVNIVFITALFLCFAITLAQGKSTEKTDAASDQAQIKQLIEQLGNPSYAEREQAEMKLLELHMEAFEPLLRARKHKDPEVAARARYLTRQIQVNLVMPGDSPRVAKLMRNIFTLDRNNTKARITELAMLPNGEGLSALCRLVRFSESETNAKMAAIGIIQSRLFSKKDLASLTNKLSPLTSNPRNMYTYTRSIYRSSQFFGALKNQRDIDTTKIGNPLSQKERDEVRRLLKSCVRPATSFVFAWFDFEEAKTDAEKKAAYDKWDKLCTKEERLVANTPTNYKEVFVFLLMTQIEKAVELKLSEEIQINLIKRQLKQSPYRNIAHYKDIIDRLIKEKAWKEAGLTIPEFGTVMMRVYNQDTLPRFFCLLIRSGKEKLGDELFELFLKSSPRRGAAKATSHNRCAGVLAQEGFDDRAIAQSEAAIKVDNLKTSRPEQRPSWRCFQRIISIYEGREEFELAAKKTAEMQKALESLPKKKKKKTTRTLPKIQKQPSEIDLLLKRTKSLIAYYKAMAEKKKGNETAYRKFLEEGLNLDTESNEVLIECYKLPVTPTSQKFHNRIVDQIQKTVVSLTRQAQRTKDQEKAANWAAWLVANTEGDLDPVIKLLESARTPRAKLSANSLNTLAICYYKKGNIEKAVSLQREAIEQEPYDRIIQKAWNTYSTAYEKKTGKKPESPKSGKERFRMMLNLPPK